MDTVNGAISGQVTVPTAGTAVQLGTAIINGPILIRAHTGNTGVVYVGNDGNDDVASTNGLELDKGEQFELQYVRSLARIYVDAATGGDKISWHLLAID